MAGFWHETLPEIAFYIRIFVAFNQIIKEPATFLFFFSTPNESQS